MNHCPYKAGISVLRLAEMIILDQPLTRCSHCIMSTVSARSAHADHYSCLLTAVCGLRMVVQLPLPTPIESADDIPHVEFWTAVSVANE